MINKISAVSFKSNQTKNDKLTPQEIRTRVYQETYGDNSAEKTALAIGGAVALGTSVAQKDINKGFGMGAAAYLGSVMVLSAIQLKKNVDNSKEYAKKYGNVDVDKAKGLEKVKQALTLPRPIDFGSDEKNKQYFEFQKNDNEKSLAQGGLSALVTAGVTLAYAGICALAKKTKYIDKAPLVALGTMFVSMFAIPLAQFKMEQKANKVNKEKEVKIESKQEQATKTIQQENNVAQKEIQIK